MSVHRRWAVCLLILTLLGLTLPPAAPAQGAAPLSAADQAAIRALLPPPAQTYLKAANAGSGDFFGGSVAVDGDTVAIGALGEDSNASGSGGAQANNDAPDAGAVYVFVRTGAGWTQQAYLKASNAEAGDFFGANLDLSGDTLIVGADHEDSAAAGVDGNGADNGAPNAGAAYVFTRSAGAWTQQAYLKASNPDAEDWFGFSVAVDGNTAVVGAFYEDSNAAGINGDQADDSLENSGAAYVFERSNGVWSQTAYLKSNAPARGTIFGRRVGVSGATIVVGEPGGAGGGGSAVVFERVSGSWATQDMLEPDDGHGGGFGISVAIDGDTIAVGALYEGRLSNEASGSGAAFVFVRANGAWSQQAYLKPANGDHGDYIGEAIALSGDQVLIGAPGDDSAATGINGDQRDNSADISGAAYVYARSGTTWTLHAYLKPSNTDAGDGFGDELALDGQMIAVGSYGEDSGAMAINGDQQDNSAAGSGAAYLFDGSLPALPVEIRLFMPLIAR
ncbi:MAG TPA: integrin [Herpetosiphonaceae bacterium]|nr:integrin [Herpetosiphonaceae bacterium]